MLIARHDDVYIYIEMIDCGESDNMIEICGQLDKPNTKNRFRSVTFRSSISLTTFSKNFFMKSSVSSYRAASASTATHLYRPSFTGGLQGCIGTELLYIGSC